MYATVDYMLVLFDKKADWVGELSVSVKERQSQSPESPQIGCPSRRLRFRKQERQHLTTLPSPINYFMKKLFPN